MLYQHQGKAINQTVRNFINFSSELKEEAVLQIFFRYCLTKKSAIPELAEKYGDPYLVLMCYNEGEYGGAIKRYESGNYSNYAVSIMERAAELENAHGKHDY